MNKKHNCIISGFSDDVLITFLCSAPDEKNKRILQKKAAVSQISSKQQGPLPSLQLLWALTSIGVVQPSLPKPRIFYYSHFYLRSSCLLQTSLMQPLLNRGHPLLASFQPFALSSIFFPHLLTCSKPIPLIYVSSMLVLRLAVWFLVALRSRPYESPPCVRRSER